MGKHIVAHGFVKNYTRWICHGEAHRAREEVLRQRIETFDAEAGCGDMIEDFHQGNFDKGPDQVMEEALELSDGEIWTAHGGVNSCGLFAQRGGV
jgi:hypothetical protein